MCPDTSLVLDETALAAGQLDTEGLRNLTALGNVLRWQKVEYDFSYHSADFLCNIVWSYPRRLEIELCTKKLFRLYWLCPKENRCYQYRYWPASSFLIRICSG